MNQTYYHTIKVYVWVMQALVVDPCPTPPNTVLVELDAASWRNHQSNRTITK
jgi:hypothetical protein